jgi:hypothetical protein
MQQTVKASRATPGGGGGSPLSLCAREEVPHRGGRVAWQERLTQLTGRDPTLCPQCGQGSLRRIEDLAPVAPNPLSSRRHEPAALAAFISTTLRESTRGVHPFVYLRYNGGNEIAGGGPRCRPQAHKGGVWETRYSPHEMPTDEPGVVVWPSPAD